MKCASCSYENPSTSRFCNHCGSKLAEVAQSLSSDERQRIIEDETIRTEARLRLRNSRIKKRIVITLGVCIALVVLNNLTKPDPAKEAIREAKEAMGTIDEVQALTEASDPAFFKAHGGAACALHAVGCDDTVKSQCSTSLTKLSDLQSRIDGLGIRYQENAQSALDNAKRYFAEGTPCGQLNSH